MGCEHKELEELAPGLKRCVACRQVTAGGAFASIGLPPKPCCKECMERNKLAMDEHSKQTGCHGCKKSKTTSSSDGADPAPEAT